MLASVLFPSGRSCTTPKGSLNSFRHKLSPTNYRERESAMESTTMFDFGEALRVLKNGRAVTRVGWNGKGQRLMLHSPLQSPEEDEMTLPYIFIRTVQGDLVPWLASQTDLLSEDWCIA